MSSFPFLARATIFGIICQLSYKQLKFSCNLKNEKKGLINQETREIQFSNFLTSYEMT